MCNHKVNCPVSARCLIWCHAMLRVEQCCSHHQISLFGPGVVEQHYLKLNFVFNDTVYGHSGNHGVLLKIQAQCTQEKAQSLSHKRATIVLPSPEGGATAHLSKWPPLKLFC